jgi:hypothetical protein
VTLPFDSAPRPVDQIFNRQDLGKTDNCSASCHPADQQPISQEVYFSWPELAQREFQITRICPLCWDILFAEPEEDEEEEEEDDGVDPPDQSVAEMTRQDIEAERYDRERAAMKEGFDSYGRRIW